MKTSPWITILLLAVQGLTGCGGGSATSPAGPSPAGVAPAPAPAGLRLFGYVSDSAFRPVAGVRIDVLDGPLAGQTMTTAATGIFDYPGTVTGAVAFRATKAGYVTATQSSQSNGGASAIVLFQLDVDAAPVQIAGDYSLTFVADSACIGRLPTDVPPLTYAATMTRQPSAAGKLDTQYLLTVRGTNALTVDSFPVGVAGNAVTLSLYHGEGPGLIERISPTRFLLLSGQAETMVATSSPMTISASLDGSIDYCGVTGAASSYEDCYGATSAHLDCTSKNNRLILTRW